MKCVAFVFLNGSLKGECGVAGLSGDLYPVLSALGEYSQTKKSETSELQRRRCSLFKDLLQHTRQFKDTEKQKNKRKNTKNRCSPKKKNKKTTRVNPIQSAFEFLTTSLHSYYKYCDKLKN